MCISQILAFAQITRTQQLPTKNHASAELPRGGNYRFDPIWTSLPKTLVLVLTFLIAGGLYSVTALRKNDHKYLLVLSWCSLFVSIRHGEGGGTSLHAELERLVGRKI